MRTLFFVTLAAAFSSSAAAQQLPPPANQQEIVVQGERNRDRQVQQFVRALTPTREPYNGQIARFEWSVCPIVLGLRPAQNEAVADRIRQVGAAIGAKLDPKPCPANTLVIVADDKDQMFDWMKHHMSGYFINSNTRPIHIARDKSHAIAWQVQDLLNADGTPAAVDRYGIYHVKADASHITATSRPHFRASVLIVDRAALIGLTTTEFADYAAMRTFAQLDPKKLKGQSAPTILTILDSSMDSALPLTLAEWDLSFLRGLYASRPNQYVGGQRHEIARSMRKDLARASDDSGE